MLERWEFIFVTSKFSFYNGIDGAFPTRAMVRIPRNARISGPRPIKKSLRLINPAELAGNSILDNEYSHCEGQIFHWFTIDSFWLIYWTDCDNCALGLWATSKGTRGGLKRASSVVSRGSQKGLKGVSRLPAIYPLHKIKWFVESSAINFFVAIAFFIIWYCFSKEW